MKANAKESLEALAGTVRKAAAGFETWVRSGPAAQRVPALRAAVDEDNRELERREKDLAEVRTRRADAAAAAEKAIDELAAGDGLASIANAATNIYERMSGRHAEPAVWEKREAYRVEGVAAQAAKCVLTKGALADGEDREREEIHLRCQAVLGVFVEATRPFIEAQIAAGKPPRANGADIQLLSALGSLGGHGAYLHGRPEALADELASIASACSEKEA